MNSITICIPTYKRPQSLEKLLLSISTCNTDINLVKSVTVIVVDNDLNCSAKETANILIESTLFKFSLSYSSFPGKGLANVRNELLRLAFLYNSDYIIFLDDDEYVSPNWLNEIVNTIIQNQTDAVRGPVIAEFPKPISNNITSLFTREKYKNNERLKYWTTGNLILNRVSLQKYNIWFDPRFNDTGSEDTYFGIQMGKKGASIVWSENAIVYETIPEKRTNISWLMKRTFRGAAMYMYILKIENKYFEVCKKILTSLLYFLTGLPLLILFFFPVKIQYWGLLKFSEGIGGFAGLINIQYKEYK